MKTEQLQLFYIKYLVLEHNRALVQEFPRF